MLHLKHIRGSRMPTSNPRVNVTFSEGDDALIHMICKKRKISKSHLVRKVMEDWLEDYEEMLLAERAEKAEEKWEKGGQKTVSHEELWKKLDS